MKRIQTLLFVITFTMILGFSSISAQAINVTIDGSLISFDQPPINYQGRILVPVGPIFKHLGAEVFWDEENRAVGALKNRTTVMIAIDDRYPLVNGLAVTLDVPAMIVNGRTMVPARFVAESLGAQVKWNASTSTVEINDTTTEKDSHTPANLPALIEKIQPSIVNIETNRSTGSGFFILFNGDIVTNAHVVNGSNYIRVISHAGQEYSAHIVDIDPFNDLALLRLDNNHPDNITPYLANFANIGDLKIGESVYAFGNPLGLSYTVTSGMVSARRNWNELQTLASSVILIQHDAAIAPGSSGGPLINSKGEVLGINTLGIDNNNFNFAVPADAIKGFIQTQGNYDLSDDFWAYTFEFKEHTTASVGRVNSQMAKATDYPLYSDLFTHYLKEMMGELTDLRNMLLDYYPKTNEVTELKELQLEYISVMYSQIEYMYLLNTKKATYSATKAEQDSKKLSRAFDNYTKKENEIISMLR